MTTDAPVEVATDGTPMWGAAETVKRGWRASPELRRGAPLTVLLAFAGTGGRLAVPILIQQAIDKGFVNGQVDMARIVRLCTIALVIITVAAFAMWGAIIRLAVRAEEALYGLRMQVFDHILGLDLADHEEERRGSLVARVTSDIETLSQFFSWGGIAWLLDGTMVIVTAIVMLVYNWKLALIAICAAAPLVLLLRVVQRHLVTAYSDVRERNAELLTSVSELVTGAAVIRAYRIGRRTTAETNGTIERHRDSSIRAGTIAAFLFPSGELFSVLTIAAVLVAGTAMGPSSGLTTGAMVGFIFLCYRFLEPVSEFTEILDQTQTAVAGWRRVLGILERPITITDPHDGKELPRHAPAIELDHVTFRYRARPGQADADNKPALRDVTVTIEPGTAVAVVGATGSGKTTLARLLTRLADPDTGVVRIGGIDLRDVSMASLRRSLVMVPQEPFLYDATIADNVRFGRPSADDDDVLLAFVELGLEDWITGLAEGLDTKVGERGDALSAGERQLVALARAYVANPPCLVLDEATSSVDALTETRLAKALDSLARGRTSVTIAHRLSTASRAQSILVFDHGRLVEHGPHDELLAVGGVYAGLYASWLDATSAGDALPAPLG
ncbi:MAG TPA: ABC transporter ATP-binding protein [Acidimicrobiales bacterium]